MTYVDAIQFLHGLRMFGLRPGLETTRELAARAGNPHERLRFIHVAGTNGKGSTCAMLESIYRAAGLRVGLFTSPHLVAFGERIQVNRQPIAEADICRLVTELQTWLGANCLDENIRANARPTALEPTFFEAVTVMALRYFAEQRCDLVIWETGLGGRLDATNIVTPLASVITTIGLDHQNWLGHTLREIAAEKAGIIKAGVPVVTGATSPEARAVIAETAARLHAPLTLVTADDACRPPLDDIELPLLGDHQRLNAAVALAAVRAVSAQIPVSQAAIRQGLATVAWAGRLQLLRRGAQRILLDGAHNLDSARCLRAALAQHFPGERPALVLGILRDKDHAEMCAILSPLAARILLTPVQNERTIAAAELLAPCRAANQAAAIVVCDSLPDALRRAADAPFVLITGSLYLIGEALELLGVTPAKVPSERGLNESHRVVP